MNDDVVQSNDMLSSSLPTIQSYFPSPTPVSIHHSSVQGRYVCATRQIEKGSIILVAQAYAKGIHVSYQKRVCDYCLRYNHAGAWSHHCLHCHQVYYCSMQCKQKAGQVDGQNLKEEEMIADETGPSSMSVSPPRRKPPIPHHYHGDDCAALIQIAKLKADKETLGLFKLLVRMHSRMQREQQQNQSSTSSQSSPAPAPLISPALPYPLQIPTASHISLLISHSPTSPSSLHAHEWRDMHRLLSRLPHGKSYINLLGAVEANAFGLYAPPPPDRSAQPCIVPPHSTTSHHHTAQQEQRQTDDDTAATISISSLTIEDQCSPSTVHQAQSTHTDSIPCPIDAHIEEEELGTKYIGRCLYPTSAYFNHSCAPNAEVIQKGHYLYVRARENIMDGEEICISYVEVSGRSVRDRRAQLAEQYYFHCMCKRCVADDNMRRVGGGVNKAKKNESSTEKNCYTSRTYVHRKQKPKKKKIEVTVHAPNCSENSNVQEHADIVVCS